MKSQKKRYNIRYSKTIKSIIFEVAGYENYGAMNGGYHYMRNIIILGKYVYISMFMRQWKKVYGKDSIGCRNTKSLFNLEI